MVFLTKGPLMFHANTKAKKATLMFTMKSSSVIADFMNFKYINQPLWIHNGWKKPPPHPINPFHLFWPAFRHGVCVLQTLQKQSCMETKMSHCNTATCQFAIITYWWKLETENNVGTLP